MAVPGRSFRHDLGQATVMVETLHRPSEEEVAQKVLGSTVARRGCPKRVVRNLELGRKEAWGQIVLGLQERAVTAQLGDFETLAEPHCRAHLAV